MNENTLSTLQSNNLLKNCSEQELKLLTEQFPTVSIPGGGILCQAGEKNHNLYLILSGRLRIHLANDRTNPVAVLEAGESIGEITIIDKQPSSATIIADCDTDVLLITEYQAWHLFETHPVIAVNLLQLLSKRLQQGNSMFGKIKELMREYEYSAMVDPLTNLYNRRWMDNMFPRIMQRSLSAQHSLGAIMLDIDYFKKFNDTHGHLAGDHALRIISHTISLNVRPEDFVIRYGGEEFFLLLPNQNLNATQIIAERLREAIKTTEITQLNGNRLPNLTASIGISELIADDTTKTFIDRADKALYKAKNSGRDQVSNSIQPF